MKITEVRVFVVNPKATEQPNGRRRGSMNYVVVKVLTDPHQLRKSYAY